MRRRILPRTTRTRNEPREMRVKYVYWC